MKKAFSTEILADNIVGLCHREDVSVYRMLKNCNLNKSIVDNLRKGSFPTVDKVAVIADYFDVSIEFLMKNKGTVDTGTDKTEL